MRLSYNGTQYSGWQKQDNARSIQSDIQSRFKQIYSQEVNIVGCGRTDAGVHARGYVAHFDLEAKHTTDDLTYKLNRMLDNDIVIHAIEETHHDFHARFDAVSRSYVYLVKRDKDPFNIDGFYLCPFLDKLSLDDLNRAARVLLSYDTFFPFCKANTDVKTMLCDITRSEWILQDEILQYHVTANRFLRGMVRLIVGMCINVGLGKVSLYEVKTALENQTRINKAWSVPPSGLYLTDVIYE